MSDNIALRTSAREGIVFYDRKSSKRKWEFFQFIPLGIDDFDKEIGRARYVAESVGIHRKLNWPGYENIAVSMSIPDGEIPYSFPPGTKRSDFNEYFGGATAYVATVHLLIRADGVAEAQDTVSAILSEGNIGTVIDWSYARDLNNEFADPVPYEISATYEEGEFAAEQDYRIGR